MAWTQADVDALQEAMKHGELSVRLPSGNLVTYQSLSEMMKLHSAMLAEIRSTARTGKGARHQSAVFCDDC